MSNELTNEQERLVEQCAAYLLGDDIEEEDFEVIVKFLSVEGGISKKRVQPLLKKKGDEILREQAKGFYKFLETPKKTVRKKQDELAQEELEQESLEENKKILNFI